MGTINAPLIFCSEFPDLSSVTVDLPFGLGTYSFDNPCAEGLNVTIGQLEGLLRPIIPFLKLLDCAIKLISIVTAIPEAIGPPPDIGKLIDLTQAVADFLADCLPYILGLLPILPTAIVEFCLLLRGIARLMIVILRCLKKGFLINIEFAADSIILEQSKDPALQKMGICLKQQNQALSDGLASKVGSIINVFKLINLLLEVLFNFIPPLKTAMTSTDPPLYPLDINITSGVTAPSDFITIIDDLLVIFTLIEGAANICAAGAS